MLKHGTEYVDAGQDYYNKKYEQRVISNLKSAAKKVGLLLIDKDGVVLNPTN